MFAKNIVVRLHIFLMIFTLAFAQPTAYAIDPITGAWTANAAASAAFGGGVSGGAAALEAAVVSAGGAAATAATAAAAAAVVAGTGIAAFCATSWAIGDNICGDGPGSGVAGFASALINANIKVNPDNGELAVTGKTYFISLVYTNQSGNGCYRTTAAQTKECYKEMIKNSRGLESVNLITTASLDCSAAPAAPNFAQCERVRVEYVAPDTGGAVQSFPTEPFVNVSSGQTVAEPEDVAAAIAKNPQSRAAAAAALAQPTLAGAQAAAAAASPTGLTGAAECAAKGMKHGTFNGAVICVGVGTATDGAGAEAGEAGSAEGAGEGTGTGEGTGEGTGNPPKAAPLPAFCTYAKTLCDWILWTKEEPASTTDTKVTILDAPENPTELDTNQRINWQGGCPSDPVINLPLGMPDLELKFYSSFMCPWAEMMRPVFLFSGALISIYIVTGRGMSNG